ncbi:MAG: polymer-forming cytoskeletal protein [Acidobacteriota bacterium]
MSFFGNRPNRDAEPSQPARQPSPQRPAQPRQSAAPARNERQAPAATAAATHVAVGTKVVGEITGDAELVINGVVEGEIRLDGTLRIGESGRVVGTVRAKAVTVGGRVEGNVSGTERVEVLASGGLEGDVISPRVVISEGAYFKGKVEMREVETKTAKPAAKNQPAKNQPNKGGKPHGNQAKATPNAGGGATPAKAQSSNPGGRPA